MLFSLTILFYSCDSDEVSEETSSVATFTAKINGEMITANTITNSNLIHQDNGINQAAILVFYAENDQYEFTVTLADYNNTTNCLSTGDYKNDIEGKEVILWISYKNNGNTYMIHLPTESDGVTAEYIEITNCSNNKISGNFSSSYEKMGEIDGLTTPDNISITEGRFENIVFNVVN